MAVSRKSIGAGLVLGLLLGAGGMWILAHEWAPRVAGYDPVRVLTGVTTAVNGDGTAIGFRGTGGDAGYAISGAMWQDGEGPWNEASQHPTCLLPLSWGQPVTLGVVKARSPGAGFDAVVWLRCNGSPLHTSP